MKKNLLFLLLYFMSNTFFAQDFHVGLRLGLNYNSYNLKNNKLDTWRIYSRGQTNFEAGVKAEVIFNDKFGASTGLIYTDLGDSFFLGVDLSSYERTYHTYYIQLPILGEYLLSEKLHFFAGPQIYLLTSAKAETIHIVGANKETTNEDLTKDFKPVLTAMTIGMSYQFDNKIFLQAGFYTTLGYIDHDQGNGQWHMSGVSFSAGYFIF